MGRFSAPAPPLGVPGHTGVGYHAGSVPLRPQATTARPASDAPSLRTSRLTLAVGLALVAVSLIPLLVTIGDKELGDLWLYQSAAAKLWSGAVPYLDWQIEYPPYALPAFFLPSLFGPLGYAAAFAVEMLLVDVGLKLLLLFQARRWNRGWLGLAPLALFALDGWAQSFLYLKRFDLVPAALVLLAVLALSRGRALSAGVAVACAVGVKVYPLVLIPVLAAAALREKRLGRFAAGVGLGLAPLEVLGFFAPWWRSVFFQADRALQAESVYASVIWLLHLTVGLPARWTWVQAWIDVQGPVAAALVVPAKVLAAATVLGSVAGATWSAFRGPLRDASRMAALLLCPLMALIAFANVLSPQFLIWYWALMALALPAVPLSAIACLAIAGPLTALIYPSPGYDTPSGLELWRTVALVARNFLLIAGWALLVFDQVGQVVRWRLTESAAAPTSVPPSKPIKPRKNTRR